MILHPVSVSSLEFVYLYEQSVLEEAGGDTYGSAEYYYFMLPLAFDGLSNGAAYASSTSCNCDGNHPCEGVSC